MRIIASNKKAYFNFEIIEAFEAGIILEGWEVKSVKANKIDIGSAYIKERSGELFLLGSNIPTWKYGFEKAKAMQLRDRKLLLHRNQIGKITAALKEKGVTVVPLEVYQSDSGLIKVTVALARGKKKYDKRSKLKEKDLKRRVEIERKKYNF
jgi:SsrA-binding protein